MKTVYLAFVFVSIFGSAIASFADNPSAAAVLIGLAILFKLDAQAAA